MGRKPVVYKHWQPIAEVGMGNRRMEIALADDGNYRVLYWMFGRDHQKFDIEPNKEALAARVDKELGKLAGAMIREALRLAEERRAKRGETASEQPECTGASPI